VEVQQPCQPFPTPEALAESDISLFQRPSDGGNLEWFEYGAKDEPSAIVWLFVHGAMSTGGVLEIFPDFDQRMRDLNVRVIAPTMPGWGASDGYKPLFEITNHVWLDHWRQDALALVDSLNIDKFWVSGMSLGGPPALALAETSQSKHRLLGVAPLISSMWNHAGFDNIAELSTFEHLALSALVNPYLGSAAAKMMRSAILASGKEDFLASPMVSGLQVQHLTQTYTTNDCCLPLPALGSPSTKVPAEVGWDREKW
jgi:pimeloyl-ACP methyl ester carboxylesterase